MSGESGVSPQSLSMPAALVSAMDVDRPQIRVAAFGLGGRFQKSLEIVFRHARSNPYRFVLSTSRGMGDYDVALVDMTVKGGARVAQTLRRLPEARPVVTVGRREDPTRAQDDLVHQRFVVNVLNVLNAVVEKHLMRAAREGMARARALLSADGLKPAQAILGRLPRVLLIDPSPVVRRQVAALLNPGSYECVGAGSAAEARTALAARRFELVLLEIDLPDQSGLALAREVKRDPALAGIQVILLTRRSTALDLIRGALARCDSYLVKPVTVSTLRGTVARALRRALLNASRLEQVGGLQQAAP